MKDHEGVGLLTHLNRAASDRGWRHLLDPFSTLSAPKVSLHLAVVVEPYLSFILDGRKTVESRFSLRPLPPYRRIDVGDVVLLKQSGGPIVGAFTAGAVWFYELAPDSWHELQRHFADFLCAQAGFWEERSEAAFATLIRVSDVRRLPAMAIPKRDRRAWIVLSDRRQSGRLF